MEFKNTEVFNFEGALRGMRNPMNSWSKSDSYYGCSEEFFCNGCTVDSRCSEYKRNDDYIIGKNDMKLAQTLIKAGNEHRKFMRQIFVSVDITAPIYWWKEFDTYKVGTVANSTSTMHKIHSKPFEMSDFSTDHMTDTALEIMQKNIDFLEGLRKDYVITKDKSLWYSIIQLLPESYNQTRTVTMTYENIHNMYFQRKNHKLTEWSEAFIKWIESLPYAKELICLENI
jgi:hypothetical protein